MQDKELTWNQLKENLNLSYEEKEEIQLEMDLIETVIQARKEKDLSQRDLAKITGIKQPSIARIESYSHSPQVSTLLKLLYPIGYTLKVVPIKTNKK